MEVGILFLLVMALAPYMALGLREFVVWFARLQPCTGLRQPSEHVASTGGAPSVAILQTICNDFNPTSLQSLMDIDYPAKAIFVLDDSDSDELKSLVEKCCQSLKFPMSYRHRQTRRGAKAGNINEALRSISDSFRYVFLADSDQLVPPPILQFLVSFLEEHPRVPFIQAHNEPVAQVGNEIPGIVVDAHHLRALFSARYRAMLKTSPCVGHGVLLNRWALAVTNGLPEIVSEDIAWSLFLLSLGHRGEFYFGEFMAEGFPPTYRAFSRRFRRWCTADLECALIYLPQVMRSRCLSPLEKADLLIGQLRFPSVALASLLGILLCTLNGIDTYLVSKLTLTLCLVVGLLPLLVASGRIGSDTVALLSQGIPLYFSQLSAVALEYLRFFCRRKAIFYVTGDRTALAGSWCSTMLHLAIAATYVAVMIVDSVHPLLCFLTLCEGVWITHHRLPWHHAAPRIARGLTVAWVFLWLVMAFTVGGAWLLEAHFLVVGVSLFF